ncbi:MAG: ATP-dependent Clp protease ATP-binding subunit [Bacilli bacterium]
MFKYSEEIKKILKQSEEEMYSSFHPYVGSEHLLLALLKIDCKAKSILNKYNITYENFKKELDNLVGTTKNNDGYIFYTPLLKRIINSSISVSIEERKEVTDITLLISLIEEGDGIGINILKNLHVDLTSLYKELSVTTTDKEPKLLLELGINLNTLAIENKLDKVIGRDEEIERVIELLARKTKNNCLLLGEAGVGKTAIVEGLSKRIVDKKVPDFLKNKKIISLNLSDVISGTKYRGEFEEKMSKIIKEIESNSDIILFIDEIHTLVGAGGAEGAIDASNILKPSLARNNIKVIGATTTQEYKKYIEKDKALDRRFQKIIIEEPDLEKTIEIIKGVKKDYEEFHHVKINDNIIKSLVTLTNKYITNRREPDKSLDILDEACAKISVNKNNNKLVNLENNLKEITNKKRQYIANNKINMAKELKEQEKLLIKKIKIINEKGDTSSLTLKTLKEVLEAKSNCIIYELSNKSVLNTSLSKNLKLKIIGQNSIIDELIKINNKIKLKTNKKPLSILFNGPSGVGKTSLALEYAKLNKLNIIKLNMSEYKNEMSINKLLGSPSGYIGYDDINTPLEKIKEYPSSVIILDEIDRAHKSILNLFLNLLDEGTIENSKGETLNFNNATFFITTNNLNNKETLGFINKETKNNNTFPIEFLGRIDYSFNFNTLKEKDMIKIIEKEAIKQNIKLKTTEINSILISSEYNLSGARKIKNLIRNYQTT